MMLLLWPLQPPLPGLAQGSAVPSQGWAGAQLQGTRLQGCCSLTAGSNQGGGAKNIMLASKGIQLLVQCLLTLIKST